MRGALLKQLCWRGHRGRGGPPGPRRGALPPCHWHGGPLPSALPPSPSTRLPSESPAKRTIPQGPGPAGVPGNHLTSWPAHTSNGHASFPTPAPYPQAGSGMKGCVSLCSLEPSRWVVLKLEHYQKHGEGMLIRRSLGPSPASVVGVGSGPGPRNLHFSKLPGDASADGLGTPLC